VNANIANRNSHKAEKMPEAKAPLHLQRIFSNEEYERMSFGCVPRDMDERWFIYLDGEWLYFHRSWTGFCIYQVHLEKVGDSYRVAEAWVNRDRQQYGREDDHYDGLLLSFLIDRILLGKNTDYPFDPSLQESRRHWWEFWKRHTPRA